MNVFDSPLFVAQAKAIEEQRKSAPVRSNRRGNGIFQRQYASAKASRITSGFVAAETSADAELISSIRTMRSRSRALCRDSSYAKRAKVVVVNNVIGTGIGMQAQVMTTRDEFNERINDDIEAAWCEWSQAENCHTGGRLNFDQLERALMSQVFEAGEVFVRVHRRSFGSFELPLTLEMIEAERLADDMSLGLPGIKSGNHFRLGVECDEFYKPVAYYFRKRHRGEIRFSDNSPDAIERVPAEDIIPLAMIERCPQTRGEPWLHTAALRLNDMDGYSEAEILRARSQAVRMGIIESGEDASAFAEQQDDGSFEVALEPNTIQKLAPGEKWIDSAPNAPNPNLSDFMRYMLREICSGAGPSYSSVSGDYSQANYSSERVSQLQDRDLWRSVQSWFICDFREKLHRIWLSQAVLAGKIPSIPLAQFMIDPRKFVAVLFKPRGWSWIDPAKEVEAFKEAIRAGFTTRSIVISQTANGLDIEDIDKMRERELKSAKERGLVYDTDPDYYMTDAVKAEAAMKTAAKAAAKPPPESVNTDETTTPPKRGVSFLEAVK